jgi:hypothetical protein
VLLLKDFEEEGNPWPGAPRLEAAFALVLAEPLVFSTRAADRDAAYAFLARYWTLVRHPLDPDDFEAEWMYAALTMLQGAIRPAAESPLSSRRSRGSRTIRALCCCVPSTASSARFRARV